MKKKFNLDSLKVKSFVTNFEKEEEKTMKGGKYPVSEKSMVVNQLSWICCQATVPC